LSGLFVLIVEGRILAKTILGIVGGSGVYDIALENARWVTVETPWGAPSDQLRVGEMSGLPVVFLPRHGRGHVYSPSSINYRANIDALKQLGVTDLVSLSAVGSLQMSMPPGTFVLPEQFIDRTHKRETSFFGTGCVAHVPFGEPVSPLLLDAAEQALRDEAIAYERGGTLVVMEGPQFSTQAESELHRSWGASLIGMTALPEAKLAREAEICYCNVAMVTDFDSWHPHHDGVDVAQVVKVMTANVALAKRFVLRLARNLSREHVACPVGADRALDNAIMTAPEMRDPALMKKLGTVLARVTDQNAG
jgi:5'-methylthioadenosine phosphorylase